MSAGTSRPQVTGEVRHGGRSVSRPSLGCTSADSRLHLGHLSATSRLEEVLTKQRLVPQRGVQQLEQVRPDLAEGRAEPGCCLYAEPGCGWRCLSPDDEAFVRTGGRVRADVAEGRRR